MGQSWKNWRRSEGGGVEAAGGRGGRERESESERAHQPLEPCRLPLDLALPTPPGERPATTNPNPTNPDPRT